MGFRIGYGLAVAIIVMAAVVLSALVGSALATAQSNQSNMAAQQPTAASTETKSPEANLPSIQGDAVSNAMTGKPHSGGYNPHGKLSSDQLIAVALQHMQEGRPNEALHELDFGVAQHAGDAELLSVRGSVNLQLGRVSAALRDFESALAIRPDDARTLTNRAEAYRQFGRIEEALKDLDRALVLAPDLVPAYFNRGSIYYSSSEFDKALQDFEQCIAIDPHAAAPYFNRGSTFEAIGEREAAVKDIKRFMELAQTEQWKKAGEELLKKWDTAPQDGDKKDKS